MTKQTSDPIVSEGLAPAHGLGRNTLLNLAGALGPIIVALATVPRYLHVIGQSRYGVLSIVWLLFSYFAVFNLGLGRATNNQVARLQQAPPEKRQAIFWTTMALNAALGVVGAVCLIAIGYPLLTSVLDLRAGLQTEMLHGLIWLAIALPFLMLSLNCIGALEGLERFDVVNGLQFATLSLYQLAPLAVAYAYGPSLGPLLAALAASVVLGGLAAFFACWRLLPLGGRPHPEWGAARSLFSFGSWVAVSEVVGPLLVIADRFVIGAVLGPRAVTRYTVPFSLVSRLALLPGSLSRSLFPRLSRLTSADASSVSQESTRVITALSTPMVVGAMVLMHPFLSLWIGDRFAHDAAPVGEIILLGVWVNTLAYIPFTYLLARGRPDLPAKLHLLELGPYILALWLGLHAGGIQGAAWAWSARVAVDAVLLGVASRLYARRDAVVGIPAAVVVASYLAVSLESGRTASIVTGIVMVALACLAGWFVAPQQARALILPTRPAEAKL